MSFRYPENLHSVVRIALLCISIAGLWWLYKEWRLRKKAQAELPGRRSALKAAITEIEALFSFENYLSKFEAGKVMHNWQLLHDQIPSRFTELGLPSDLVDLLGRFVSFYRRLSTEREIYNEAFVIREATKYSDLFNNLEPYPLYKEQVEAIIRDEDNNLVIAGAGTGKTTTIAGKVAYILEKKLALPEELLIISFTNNAVAEMRQRCARFCQHLPDAHLLDIRTFNGFGYFVKRSCTTEELHLAFGGDQGLVKIFLKKTFDRLFLEDRNFQKKAINFISFFNRPERDEFAFETNNDFLKYEESFKNRTLDGVQVKSKEELQIANFFCLNSIAYEYEKHYPLQPEDRSANNASYYPDFFLTDHDIWHEHYGIDREGNVPKRFRAKPGFATGKDYYQALMQWKDGIHQKYGTKLIKTYSYENNEGRLLANLKSRLNELGVPLTPKQPEEILELVRHAEQYEDFFDLIATFLNLMKSNGKTPEAFKSANKDKRFSVFMDVFDPLFQVYQKELENRSAIDFHDMINEAAGHFIRGEFNKPYKYILVDEFQDMSLGRYALLQSIRKQNPAVKLYAVGDDWQSIFRFTGSDISIITQFEKYFGYTRQTSILRTYRFNQEILDISSKFIQQNPAQLRKALSASSVANGKSFLFRELRSADDQVRTAQIVSILNEIEQVGGKATVFIIGRYKSNRPIQLEAWSREFKGLHIEYHTAHKVKGMTCDHAILLDLNSGVFGFPSEMADDPILEHLLHEGDNFENAEERRVFYVAITRAKHKNYLLYEVSKPSKFVVELQADLDFLENSLSCPECQGIMVKRKGKYNEFYGCSNYPRCDGKLPVHAEPPRLIKNEL